MTSGLGAVSGEATRYSMKHQWVYLLALLTVGLSFALPLLSIRVNRVSKCNHKWNEPESCEINTGWR